MSSLDDLERPKRILVEKIVLRRPPENEDKLIGLLGVLAAKMQTDRTMILVSRNIRYMQSLFIVQCAHFVSQIVNLKAINRHI